MSASFLNRKIAPLPETGSVQDMRPIDLDILHVAGDNYSPIPEEWAQKVARVMGNQRYQAGPLALCQVALQHQGYFGRIPFMISMGLLTKQDIFRYSVMRIRHANSQLAKGANWMDRRDLAEFTELAQQYDE
jgi:hypothetical protein